MQQKKKTIFKFLILFCALIGPFWSCSQDIGLDNPNWHQASYAEDNDLVCTAKSAVNDMQGNVSMLDMFKTLGKVQTRANGEVPQTLKDGSFSFEWEESRSFKEEDGEVLIVPIKMKQNISVWRFSLINNKGKKEQTPMYSVLYIKKFYRSDATVSRILSYAPARKHLRKFRERKDFEWYDPTHTDYSGLLLVSSLNGILSHAINFEKGHREYIVRPKLRHHNHAHSINTRTIVTDSVQSLPNDVHLSNVAFFNMRTVTSNSAIRSYSYDDETYEQPGCIFCGGDPYTCDCLEVVVCKECGYEPDNCACKCVICNEAPCICEYCKYCFNVKTDCICPSDNNGGGSSSQGGGTSNDNGGTSGSIGGSSGNGGSSVGGSGSGAGDGGSTIIGGPSVNIIGGTTEQQNIIRNIINTLIDEYSLDFAGINLQIEDIGSCLSTARILPGYAGIGICPAFFNYSFYDQMAIL